MKRKADHEGDSGDDENAEESMSGYGEVSAINHNKSNDEANDGQDPSRDLNAAMNLK